MRRRRRAAPASLTLRDLDLPDVLCLLAGWQPPQHTFDRERSRWATWQEFLTDYEHVRAELPARPDGREPFAERVRRYRETFGAAALDAATYEDLHDARSEDDADDDTGRNR